MCDFAPNCFLLTRISSPGELQVTSKTEYLSVLALQTDGRANKDCVWPQKRKRKKKQKPVTLPSLDCLVPNQGTMLNETASKTKGSVFDLKVRTVL